MGRTFQHSSLFDELTARENVAIAVQRKLGHAPNPVRQVGRFPDVAERSEELLGPGGLADLGDVDAGLAVVRPPAPARDRAGACDRADGCCSWTSRRRGCHATRRSGSEA